MSDLSTTYADLAAEVAIQEGGTISKTSYQDNSLKVVLFGFDAGQELSEHTAAVPAVLQFLDGDAKVTLDEKKVNASANPMDQTFSPSRWTMLAGLRDQQRRPVPARLPSPSV
jgi:hypothetical protein